MNSETLLVILYCVYAPVTILFIVYGLILVLGWLND